MSDHSGSTAENASLEADLAANLDEDKLIRLAREDLAQFRPLYERWLPPVYRLSLIHISEPTRPY